MALADELRSLKDRVLADLTSAHDYYTDTKIAWRIVHIFIASGRSTTIRYKTTGTITRQLELGAIGCHDPYITDEFSYL